MWVAAWARAERCPLSIIAGRFEPHCRHTPSDELWVAVAQTAGDLAGALLFGIPVMLDDHKRAYAASWPMRWEVD